ncbi:hypothetical protein SpCBS45565_g02398 [Spizellomyces sp. 'palustris']|nr:hypothetical protein SpCBS45565_g02398 [Spizellomyces sp. 'palustris']
MGSTLIPPKLSVWVIFFLWQFTHAAAQTSTTSATPSPTATPTGGGGGGDGGPLDILDKARQIIAQTAVLGAITLVVGVFLLLFGQRFFKVTLFIGGFFVTALVGYLILTAVEPSSGYPNRATVLLLGPLASGVIGGGLALCVWRLGLVAIGAAAGFLFAMFILSWQTGGVIGTAQGRIIFLAAMTGVGGLAVSFFQKILLVVATSIGGAYSIVFGIDCYARTGFTDSTRQFLVGENKFSYTVFERNGKVIALLCSMIAFAIIGMIIQFRFFKRRDD